MNLILFDIDSTLLVSHGTGQRAADRAFRDHFGLGDFTVEVKLHGRTDPDIFAEVARIILKRDLEEAETLALFELYRGNFADEIGRENTIHALPGAADLCSYLHRFQDHILGIETGNIEPVAWQKLAGAGLDSYFSFGGFSTDAPLREDIVRIAIERGRSLIQARGEELEKVFVIGDAPQDIMSARASGATAIAVATGASTLEELRALGADLVLPNLLERRELLQLLLSE